MSEPILYDSHMHTPLCRHAVGEPEEYAAVAQQRGLKGIIVTCHNPIPDGYAAGSRMFLEDFEEYLGIVERARNEWQGRVDVRLGLECDFYPGCEPWIEKQIASANFHHVLGSVHPHIRDYRDRYYPGNMFDYQCLYFEHLAQAAETKMFTTLAHPDLIKHLAPEEWNIDAIMPSIRQALDRIAATGTAMELNTSGMLKAVPEMNPGFEMLCEMQARGIPIVLGSDAHAPERVADCYETALDVLQQADYETVSLFLGQQRCEISIADARESLKPSPTEILN